jgi:hypothetical protein
MPWRRMSGGGTASQFFISALNVIGELHAQAHLAPRKEWAPGYCGEKKIFLLTGFETRQSSPQHNYAIRAAYCEWQTLWSFHCVIKKLLQDGWPSLVSVQMALPDICTLLVTWSGQRSSLLMSEWLGIVTVLVQHRRVWMTSSRGTWRSLTSQHWYIRVLWTVNSTDNEESGVPRHSTGLSILCVQMLW